MGFRESDYTDRTYADGLSQSSGNTDSVQCSSRWNFNVREKNNEKKRLWVSGSLSPYQLHDITHRPDWENLIVWDAYLNNMTSGFMVITGLAWMAGPGYFTALLPWAITVCSGNCGSGFDPADF